MFHRLMLYSFNYIIQSYPLPVSNYVGEVQVKSLGDNLAQQTWRGTYQPVGVSAEVVDGILQGFYDAIAGRIGELHTRRK